MSLDNVKINLNGIIYELYSSHQFMYVISTPPNPVHTTHTRTGGHSATYTNPSSLGDTSINPRHHLPPYLRTVPLPRSTVLPQTPPLVALAAVHEDHRHENSVRPRDQTVKPTDRAHGVREEQVADVICVADNAPAA